MAGAVPAWFSHDRFGMFVHLGVYSALARHEWVMTNERIDPAEYERLARYFDPDLFDADALARAAKDAGMGYLVLTAKHHDGFALYETNLSDYSSTAFFGRDLVAETVEACRRVGLRVGLYYSLIDWNHPDFTIDFQHPLRDRPDAAELNSGRDMDSYRRFLHGQVRELLTGYGQIDYVFYDFTYPWEQDGWVGKGPKDWDAAGLLAMTRELQPGAVVNDRLGIPGDLVTPEQYLPDAPMMTDDGAWQTWEACHTMNGAWGYDRENRNLKSPDLLIRTLIDIVSKNGNFLLNIGPDGRGAITGSDAASLGVLAEWMRLHRQAIVGAGPVAATPAPGTAFTARADRIYVHLLHWPLKHVHLRDLPGSVQFARFLHDGSQLQVRVAGGERTDANHQLDHITPGEQPAGTVTLQLPAVRPEVAVPVVELFLGED
ncbi:alpha-L-fucosidase [Ruania halotolerans]|uniref:alpha-L-fucosidase n=1 Tax=Ruania halotolerans TaxID=2897773 RepID=UPI001E2953F2|nr:alpha-L-fucosidase [Ruania halotolerans]UFU06197.1 alpha-L-fucosidase [Ruania halotolerans]